MNLDHELRRALKRKNPPRGFEHRVLTRIAAGETVRTPVVRPRWQRSLMALAASLVLTFAATYYLHQREQQRQAQEQSAQAQHAVNQVTLALRITSEKLAAVQTKVLQEINEHEAATQP